MDPETLNTERLKIVRSFLHFQGSAEHFRGRSTAADQDP